MDVRSPIEYQKGSIQHALNLPLLSDDERHLVGCAYKKEGEDAAIELGNKLVRGGVKKERMKLWVDFCRRYPNGSSDGCDGGKRQEQGGYLFCFRGGLRSQTVQRWIEEEIGIRYPIVTGGYKAMRTFLLEELDQWSSSSTSSTSSSLLSSSLVVVCGKTGSGKTRVINDLKEYGSIDLEGLANHRGSAFGNLPGDAGRQPSQSDFENSVVVDLLRALEGEGRYGSDHSDRTTPDGSAAGAGLGRRIFMEDEGNRIGNLGLPVPLSVRMKACDGVVVIDQTVEERVDVILQDYVLDLRRRFIEDVVRQQQQQQQHGGGGGGSTDHGSSSAEKIGFELHRDYCLNALGRIQKRLGGDRYELLRETMEAAFREDIVTTGVGVDGDVSHISPLHWVWITSLLVDYYDKMYDYQFAQRDSKVLFQGDRNAVVEWAKATDTSHNNNIL